MSTAERDHAHRHKRTGVAVDALAVIAAMAAVFGFAALAIAQGFGPVEVAAVVVAVTTAAERLVRLVQARRSRAVRAPAGPARKQWGPSAATEDPRPQIAEPSRRSDRELNGPRDGAPSGSRDRYVTECGDVTSLLSSHPRPDGVNEDEVTPVTSTDTVGVGWPVGARRRRTGGGGSAARSDRPRSSY